VTKITISVCKVFKNSGSFRLHRKKTKKEWKHYFLDVDEYEQGDYTFQTEGVSAFKAIILKRNQFHKKIFVCLECYARFTAYVPKNTSEYKDECPFCGE